MTLKKHQIRLLLAGGDAIDMFIGGHRNAFIYKS